MLQGRKHGVQITEDFNITVGDQIVRLFELLCDLPRDGIFDI